VAGQVTAVAASGGSWQAGGSSGTLVTGQPIYLTDGQRVRIVNGSDAAELVLPTGGRVFLEPGAEIAVVTPADAMDFELLGGRVVVHSGDAPVNMGSAVDARAVLPGPGVMGAYLNPVSLLFEVACLTTACRVAGAADEAPLDLAAGQGSLVGSGNSAGPAEPADFAAYVGLAPNLVPLPTATPTTTPTPTPTRTPTLPQPTEEDYSQPTSGPAGGTPDATATKLYSDEDRDGVLYHSDRCPLRHGTQADGCPPAGATPESTEQTGPEPTDEPTPYPGYP
jgi:hypothetical protein